MNIIKATDLKKVYPGGVAGLEGINLNIKAGEMVGILGPSGSGKTTFFRLLNGSLLPTSGKLEVLNQSLSELNHRKLRPLRSKIALVYQNNNVIPNMSVAQNVLMGSLGNISLFQGIKKLFHTNNIELTRIQEVLNKLGIEDKIDNRCSDLSGGQQQRVAVARALFSQPEIILADEPIASVDMKSAELILTLFRKMNQEGKTVLINLHQIDFALHYCSRLVVLNKGYIIYDGEPTGFTETNVYRENFATELRGVENAV